MRNLRCARLRYTQLCLSRSQMDGHQKKFLYLSPCWLYVEYGCSEPVPVWGPRVKSKMRLITLKMNECVQGRILFTLEPVRMGSATSLYLWIINLSRFSFVNGNLDNGFFQIYFQYIFCELQKKSDLQIGIRNYFSVWLVWYLRCLRGLLQGSNQISILVWHSHNNK